MSDKQTAIPDSTAVRTALWRALHVQVDPPPHVIEDEIGLKLVAPDEGWRNRPDMNPQWTSRFRASILARSRFVEDLATEQANHGVRQYAILGAGLDSFAQRRPEIGFKMRIFEVDAPATSAWKQKRLTDLGFVIPDYLRFVPVDFEERGAWWKKLTEAGFDEGKPAVVTSLGVSMNLTLDAIKATLRQAAELAPGSTFIMTFLLPIELVGAEDRPAYQKGMEGAKVSGTAFISLFPPDEMLNLAREAGFKKAEHLSTASLADRYFAGRKDGLRPSTGEEFLIATT